jgi:hypothetical protein
MRFAAVALAFFLKISAIAAETHRQSVDRIFAAYDKLV